jgi:hypothetical protein
MEAVAVKLASGGKLLPSYSMAFTSSNAFITAAKWDYNTASALILRVYQPNNARMSSTLSLAPSFTKYSAVSALELPVINAKVKPSVSKSGGVYHLTLPRALSTFKME